MKLQTHYGPPAMLDRHDRAILGPSGHYRLSGNDCGSITSE